MTTATLQPRSPLVPQGARQHVVLTGVSWETYRRLRHECDRLHLKMTYDRGRLEIMPPLPDRAVATRFIDQIITVVSEELNIPIAGYRDTTWQREQLGRALEADDCYYVQNVAIADARGTQIDLTRDPPPDLAIETDITHSTLDKESIYAALGVPELWRWDNGVLTIRLLEASGQYADAARSRALPMLDPKAVEQFVHRRLVEGESRTRNAFREWVRQTLAITGPG